MLRVMGKGILDCQTSSNVALCVCIPSVVQSSFSHSPFQSTPSNRFIGNVREWELSDFN